MQPAKRKPPTKGAQQIIKENAQTFKTFQYLSLGTICIRLISSLAIAVHSSELNATNLTTVSILSHVCIPTILYMLCFLMKRIGMPLYSNTEERKLIIPAYDLNMEGGWGEHLKDIIILLAVTHIMSLVSPMFWFLLLLFPLWAIIQIWKYIMWPFFSIKCPDNRSTSQDREKLGKKAKKLVTKRKRLKYVKSVT